MRRRVCIGRIVVAFSCLVSPISSLDDRGREAQYMILGVSGTLQDGFALRDRLDFKLGETDETRAVYMGKGLVRGYKAYLDIKEEGWREYLPEPENPNINHVVLPSGCHEHANIYWFYAVDTRQVLSILSHEPRFLGISPDTGLVDLTAAETSRKLRKFAIYESKRQARADMDSVAIPLVTGVWYHASFVPSPPIYTKEDGTEVTSFETSLVLWAGDCDKDREDAKATMSDLCVNTTCLEDDAGKPSGTPAYDWDLIHQSVRKAEGNPPLQEEHQWNGPPFRCSQTTRLGVGPETARINNPFTHTELMSILEDSTEDEKPM